MELHVTQTIDFLDSLTVEQLRKLLACLDLWADVDEDCKSLLREYAYVVQHLKNRQ